MGMLLASDGAALATRIKILDLNLDIRDIDSNARRSISHMNVARSW
jgi:hypothetical protein